MIHQSGSTFVTELRRRNPSVPAETVHKRVAEYLCIFAQTGIAVHFCFIIDKYLSTYFGAAIPFGQL